MADVSRLLKLYEEAKRIRSPFETDWRATSRFCLPRHVGAWDNMQGPAQQGSASLATRRIYDNTGSKGLAIYCAVVNRLTTPRQMRYHGLCASNPQLMKIKAVRNYFDDTTDILFKERYDPKARFSSAQAESLLSFGCYGNHFKFITKRKPNPYDKADKGLHYRSIHIRDCYVLLDDEGNLRAVIRVLWLNARQCSERWPDQKLPKAIQNELDKGNPSEDTFFEVIHFTAPRNFAEYDPMSFDAKSFPVMSVYVSVKDQEQIADEGGYTSMAYVFATNYKEPGDVYGYAAAQRVLSAMGVASNIKKTALIQGERAARPAYLAYDDNIKGGNVDTRPDKVNYGGLDNQGRELVKPLKGGDLRVAETMLENEQRDIGDEFFMNIFQIMKDNPQMNPEQIAEIAVEKAALLAPTMERLQSEDMGPQIARELDILAHMRKLPDMPPELQEAAGEYEIIYTSPAAKGQKAEEVAGFVELANFAMAVAGQTKDPKPLRRLNFDAAIPEIAYSRNIPSRWIRSDEEISAMDEQDSDNQKMQQLADAGPAIAGVAKAAATFQNQTPKGPA